LFSNIHQIYLTNEFKLNIKLAIFWKYPRWKFFWWTNHFNQPFLVWIFGVYLNHFYFESITFPASRKHARRWSVSRKSMRNHAWVSPQLLKNSFITSGQQDSNPLPSIFDSQHRSFWLESYRFTPILVG
jgi:hypothetical protein